VDGKEHRESTGETDYKAAQRVLRTRLAEIDASTYVGPARDRMTVGDLLTGLLDYYVVQGHRSLSSAAAQVKPLREALGTCRALDLTTARVRRLTKDWQQGGVTNATINRRLSLLRRAYSLGKIVLDPAKLDFTDLLLSEQSPLGKHLDPAAFAAIHGPSPPTSRISSNSPTSAAPGRDSLRAPPGRTGTPRRGSSPGAPPR
jgi:hypothetical protein